LQHKNKMIFFAAPPSFFWTSPKERRRGLF
jgi:hypothetical protein